MGPIMQERTTSTTLKRVVSKEKIRTKNSENNGPVMSSKKANKVKKAGIQQKKILPGPGQDKDNVSTLQSGIHPMGSRIKSGTGRNTSKLASPQEEGGLKSKLHPHSSQRQEEKREVQRMSRCCGEMDQNHGALAQSRKALSLPLSPILGPRQGPMRLHTSSQVPTLESLRQFEQNEDDADSASDLSDSERLPILPSPCTPCSPPHLNLRAEVINSNDFPPAFPGPHWTTSDSVSYSYPDFLPPPFNTWSLRQLAVFLHTEGKGAPRPKPVGPLEKYLERLLQLEWLQIQTVQEESCRPAGSRPRSLGFPAASTSTVNPPRPHTAPTSRLSSPKDLRQCSRTFPSTPHNNPPSLGAQQLPVCPHCHIRYPLCNGSCSSYVYQRHSRLSPLLERRARPSVPPKRSSSESRVTSSDGRATSLNGGQTPHSPSAGRSHLRHMQAVGNIRKPAQELPSNSKSQVGVKKGRARYNWEAERGKESCVVVKADVGVEKRGTSTRAEKDCRRTESRGQASKSGIKRTAKEPTSLSKAALSAKANEKSKNVHFVPK
ncbi:uncharacterized protein fam217b [Esox lucius]|uniref:Family with sequence similarity 217 member B n=2 Tax=Esox lucius TaxID=8010 RepID=A0A6Q2Y749_ESOLU|nr:uncharacterized protein fam217b [Esox lucius]